MENFILALNVISPIALTISLGIILKTIKMLDDHTITTMNKIVFKIFMSTLMFINIYNIRKTDIDVINNLKFLVLPIFIVIGIYLIAALLYYKKIPDRKKFAVMIQGTYRGNFTIFGLPVAESIYGQEGVLKVAMLLAIVIPLYNIIAVITLEYYSGKEINWKRIFKATLKNPLIIASVLAMLFIKLNIEFPNPIYKTLVDLGRITTPLAFVILGASLKLGSMLKNIKYLISVNFMKLVFNPLFTLIWGHFFKLSGSEMVALLAMSACPTAVSSFTMAKEMNVDGEFAGEIVVSTTLLSILTVFIWIVVLKNLTWI